MARGCGRICLVLPCRCAQHTRPAPPSPLSRPRPRLPPAGRPGPPRFGQKARIAGRNCAGRGALEARHALEARPGVALQQSPRLPSAALSAPAWQARYGTGRVGGVACLPGSRRQGRPGRSSIDLPLSFSSSCSGRRRLAVVTRREAGSPAARGGVIPAWERKERKHDDPVQQSPMFSRHSLMLLEPRRRADFVARRRRAAEGMERAALTRP